MSKENFNIILQKINQFYFIPLSNKNNSYNNNICIFLIDLNNFAIA